MPACRRRSAVARLDGLCSFGMEPRNPANTWPVRMTHLLASACHAWLVRIHRIDVGQACVSLQTCGRGAGRAVRQPNQPTCMNMPTSTRTQQLLTDCVVGQGGHHEQARYKAPAHQDGQAGPAGVLVSTGAHCEVLPPRAPAYSACGAARGCYKDYATDLC